MRNVNRNLITDITRKKPVATFSIHRQVAGKLRYGMAVPFQVSPTEGALFLGCELIGGACVDFAAGAEVLIFDDLNNMDLESSIPILENSCEINPDNGEEIIMQRFLVTGGFVPLGACLSDGRAHPHAGTGFGVTSIQGFPKRFENEISIKSSWLRDENIMRGLEVLQFSYDGKNFSVTKVERFEFDQLLDGYSIYNRGLGMAVHDGEDLLYVVQGCKNYDAGKGDTLSKGNINIPAPNGVMRWKRIDGCWKPVSFTRVCEEDIQGFEPSIVRNAEGDFFYSMRQTGSDETWPEKFSIDIWKSDDNGNSWKKIIHAPRMRAMTPVTINITAGNVIYVAGNLLTGSLRFENDRPLGTGIGNTRDILCIWPLNEKYTGFDTPLIARCATLEWGLPPDSNGWNIDHPVGCPLRLSDGEWHDILCYRGMARAETKDIFSPTEWTGFYVEELTSSGEAALNPWFFK